MLIKRAVGHPQFGNHRPEAVSEPSRVPASRRRDVAAAGAGVHRGGRDAVRRRHSRLRTAGSSKTSSQEPAQRRPTKRSRTRWEQITTLQQLLRVRRRQGLAVAVPPDAQARAVDRPIEGECSKKGNYTIEDILKGETLEERIYRHRCVERWSMVIPWVGFPLANFIKRVRADLESEVRRVHDAERSGADAGRAAAGARLAVRRRPAHGRGDASADAPRRRAVRRGAAEPERRAAAAGGAVEVRLQGHQVDRADPVRREAAAQHLAGVGAATNTASTRT